MRAGNGETEPAFFRGRDARPPSRFSSEIGSKADAKQVDRASARVDGDASPVHRGECPESFACGRKKLAGFVKEYWFAYV